MDSGKGLNIALLDGLIKTSTDPSQRIGIWTSFGIVVGTLVVDSLFGFDPEADKLDAFIDKCKDDGAPHLQLLTLYKLQVLNQIPEELRGSKDNDDIITLKDVTLFMNGFKGERINCETYFLQSDAVLGFSVIPSTYPNSPE